MYDDSNTGKIEVCPHCEGKKGCFCFRGPYDYKFEFRYGSASYEVEHHISCVSCLQHACLVITEKVGVLCSICGGKGKMWIGPPQAGEMHQHQHTHEAPSWDLDLLTETMQEFVQRAGEILENQERILEQLVELASSRGQESAN